MSIIKNILQKNGLDESCISKFEDYYSLLNEWNEKINLTAITGEEETAFKHFLDSVSPLKTDLINENAKIIDIGTGAGFPGIPLKICREDISLTMVDSLNKRVGFLNEVIKKLDLKNTSAFHSRAEEMGQNPLFREKFDICVSRAVANLSTLTELCLPFVKAGGYFISLKGPKADEEVENAKNAIGTLGGKFIEIKKYSIDSKDYDHNMVIIKKVRPTDKKYPRNAPKPYKNPIK